MITSSRIPLYPLRFRPILKQAIWGGNRILPFKRLDEKQEGVGECWEISAIPGSESIVSEGPLQGTALPDLLDLYKSDIVGHENYRKFGNTFPLLIKFIDAYRDLSIQVHPNDEIARRKHQSLGKAEMWYIMDAAPDATLINGIKHPISYTDLEKHITDNSLTDVLQKHQVSPGNVYYIPAGRIHAIGGGIFLVEIQETSNVTYRIFDYNRKDHHGNPRELHTQLAQEAIDYKIYDNYQTHYQAQKNQPTELLSTPHFTTTLYELTQSMQCDYSELDSFVIYICLEGNCRLQTQISGAIDGTSETVHTLQPGDTILLPAITRKTFISPQEHCKLLETFV